MAQKVTGICIFKNKRKNIYVIDRLVTETSKQFGGPYTRQVMGLYLYPAKRGGWILMKGSAPVDYFKTFTAYTRSLKREYPGVELKLKKSA